MSNMLDLTATVIDIFEGFLETKGISIPNEDKEGEEDETIIFSTDYFHLEDQISKELNKSNNDSYRSGINRGIICSAALGLIFIGGFKLIKALKKDDKTKKTVEELTSNGN